MNLQLPILGRTAAPAAALALAMAIGVAACGGAASTDGGVVSLASPVRLAGRIGRAGGLGRPRGGDARLPKCMKEHGVDIQMSIATADGGGGGVQIGGGPDAGTEPQPATGAFDPKAMEEADKACRDLLPAGGMLGDPNATMDPALADQMLKFAQCMRDHGVDFPDPQFSGGGVSDPGRRRRGRRHRPDVRDVPGGAGGLWFGAARRRSVRGGRVELLGRGGGPAIEVKP